MFGKHKGVIPSIKTVHRGIAVDLQI
jgi:hypothetical protein